MNRVENQNEPKRPQKGWPFGFVLVFTGLQKYAIWGGTVPPQITVLNLEVGSQFCKNLEVGSRLLEVESQFCKIWKLEADFWKLEADF